MLCGDAIVPAGITLVGMRMFGEGSGSEILLEGEEED